MRAITKWSINVPEKDNQTPCVWDICLSPDGSKLLVASGYQILVCDSEDGTIIQPLKAHKDNVYCIDYAVDGKIFATGSADKSVIIWTNKFEGILRFSHTDAIQCLTFNPVTQQLASGTRGDYGLWSSEEKAVPKHRVTDRITSMAWTNDGQYLAIGMYNGVVSLRSKIGEEKLKIERTTGPVWSVSWSPVSKDELYDNLAIGDWGQRLSFYQLTGKQINKDRYLGFDPMTVSWFNKGEYVLIGGSNNECSLYTREGIKLGVVGEFDSWVIKTKYIPESNCVVVATNKGVISCQQILFYSIHGLYHDRYAYRDNMTDVVVQHLITEQKVKIKCRSLISKIAIYKNRLAVQLPERVVIYEVLGNDSEDMHYRVKERLNKLFECTLLVVCSNHLILCQEKKLQCVNFQGVTEREWLMESHVKYLKVIGGPPGQETLLLGLKNGQIWKIFVNSPFPILLLKQNTAIRGLDISCMKSKLAVVDENNTLLVYDITSKELLFEEANAESVSWNSNLDDMLAFSGNGILNIKAANYPVQQQKIQGLVVCYHGSKIFCLNHYTMKTVDVPQSVPMYQYLDKKMFKEAYEVACLGVTESDWDALANEALEGLNFEISKKAFSRTHNLHFLRLIESIEDRQKRNEIDNMVFLGDVYSFQGKFHEAAKLYKKAGQEQKALTMYSDLRMFEYAKEFVGSGDQLDKKKLIAKQADWAKSSNDPRAAAQMYITAGEYSNAIKIITDNGWVDLLIDLARKLDKADLNWLTQCAKCMEELGEHGYAAEIYTKMGDLSSIINLHINTRHWEDAFTLADKHLEYKQRVFVAHAQWLAENDRFEEAQQAFHEAGLQDNALKVLEELTHNAVTENRFSDAGYYYWKLSMQCLDLAADETKKKEMLTKFYEFQTKADIYYVYHSIQRCTEEPFTSHLPEALFNMARFILPYLGNRVPGIKLVYIYYCLANQSKALGAYRLARFAYDRLKGLQIPSRLQDIVNKGCLTIRAKPFNDAEELLPLCYRCSTTNPLLNTNGNLCVNCKEKFVHSFVSFENLPLVEFVLESGITDEEAVQILDLSAPKKRTSLWNNSENTSFQSLNLSEERKMEDPFTQPVQKSPDSDAFSPVRVSREFLSTLSHTEVFIQKWPRQLGYRYFRSLLPDITITICPSCFKMFHTDDFELNSLVLGHCPYCRCRNDE